MRASTETEFMTVRSTSMVLLMLTILLVLCWLIMEDARLMAAALITGLIGLVNWLSYCQQKTTAEIAAVVAKSRNR